MESAPTPPVPKPERPSARAGSSQTHSRSLSARQPHNGSGGPSVVYRPQNGAASIESTLEALRLSADAEAELDSSIEFILTPPRHPRYSEPLARSTPAFPSDVARPRSISTELPTRDHDSTLLAKCSSNLNLEVAPFLTQSSLGPASAVSLLARFHEIVKEGKDLIGELRLDAKVALADLGLKPIPSLHGSAQLPYARNPS